MVNVLKRGKMKYLKFLLFGICLYSGSAYAVSIATDAEYALVVDYDTNSVMMEKNADVPMHPASMSKLMTLYILLDKIKSGVLSLDDEFLVSEYAWKKGGASTGSSTMFLKVGQNVKVRDLLQGIIVQSGNDACITVAENLAGSEEEFVKQMNKKAQEIGLQDSHFTNSTGWPDDEHLMSARDIAELAAMIIKEFPEYYEYFSQQSFTFNGIKQNNRNPLLFKDGKIKADGLKTGHTTASGYGLVASAVAPEGDRRVIVVINGVKTMKKRGEETSKLLDWAIREFEHMDIAEKGAVVGDIPVFWGNKDKVPVVASEKVVVNTPKTEKDKIKAVIRYTKPVKAPVKKGDKIADIVISSPHFNTVTVPALAGEDIDKLGYWGELWERLKYLFGVETYD